MATSFASSSTSTSYGNVYDVFLNHRGPDVKKTLASHIYHRLSELGLRVFLDSQEMHAGEELTHQIREAIRTASVHVAIFSGRYADSRWCLDELVLMAETEKTIIPIFYDVNPSDLRWTQDGDGVYARALLNLENKKTWDSQPNEKTRRYDSITIETWRKTLFNVSNISGFHLNACNSDEGLLVDKVIHRVLEKVRKAPLNVAKYPTGLEVKVKEVETIVSSQQQSGNLARAVGIVGLGGVGKTTLAKQFFNCHRATYERSCFLSEVRENAARNSLNSLQTQLLKDLAQHSEQISTTAEGIEMLKRYLPSCRRALVVLDDVDHIDQLDALFSPVKHTRSLILVTSRNKDVLTSAEIVDSSIYVLRGLNQQHSKVLFCSHAFNQPYPVKGFEQLVDKFLDACDGLPLSLKVIGALLCGKRDLNFWKQQLLKISKILPTDIQSRLKISYDGLDEEEKEIFLDIACFFIGTDMDTAIRIWDGSGWQGWLGLRNLRNRCLVDVGDKNCLTMHYHLRDLGRDLAKNSEYPLRLWRLTDNPHSLSNHSSVRGIHMVHKNDAEQSFEDLADCCNMRRLQLLRAEGDLVERVFSLAHLRQLIYLHWDNCPFSSLPPSIPIKKLRVLYIEGESLEALWQHESQAPLELREMVIHARLQMIPTSIGKLKHLEKFVLSSIDLETFPDSIGNLTNLQSLDLRGCSGLQMLPDSVGNMTNLQSLHLGTYEGLQRLPDSLENMVNIQSPNLGWHFGLQRLPDSVGNLTNLQILDLSGCLGLQILPDSVGNMTNLRSLDLGGCCGLQVLPNSVGNLTNLQSFDLGGCCGLQVLPNSVGNMMDLQSLVLAGCSDLQRLPDSIGKTMNLQNLTLSDCSSLQTLPDSVGSTRNLQSLDLGGCSGLQTLPDSVGTMTNLQNLDLGGCSSLQMIPDTIGNLTNLQSLYLGGCSRLQMLPDSVGKMAKLQSLNLFRCYGLQRLPDSVGNLTNLQSLDLSGCSGLQMLPDSVGNMTKLQSLNLLDCSVLEMLPDSVGNMTNLQTLDLGGCSRLQMLPDSVENMTNLWSLVLFECFKLQMLPDWIGNMTNLQRLHLGWCCGLRMLPDWVGNMTNLQGLYLGRCSSLQRLPDSVGNMMNLQSLNLFGCSSLQMLPESIGNMTNLQSLRLVSCSSLQMLPDSVGDITNLRELDLHGCSALQMLPDSVGKMRKLRKLDLEGCSALQILLPIVEHLSSLEILDVSACPKLQWGAGVVEQLRQRLNTGFIDKEQVSEEQNELCGGSEDEEQNELCAGSIDEEQVLES